MAVACQDLLDVLSCLADPDALLTRKSYLLRHLLSCLSAAGPSCEVAHLAEEVHVQHAPAIVTAWVDAALAVASDSCLLSDLGSLASILCSAQRPLTDMFAEALIMSCCSNTGLTGATSASDCTTGACLMHGAALQLLPTLLEDSPSAAEITARLLLSNPALCAGIAASLTETAGSVEYVVSVLRLLSSVFRHPSVEGRQLMALVGTPTFARAALILSVIATTPKTASPNAGVLEKLRVLCLGVLSTLAASGCMLLDGCGDPDGIAPSGALRGGGGVMGGVGAEEGCMGESLAEIAGNLLAGTKPCLMSADTSMQLQAAQLLAALCGASHPALLQQLINADLVEYLCECVRSHAGPPLKSTGGHQHQTLQRQQQQQQQQQQHASALMQEHTATLQAAVVRALRCLSLEGSLFQQHMVYGLDTMVRLCNGAVTSGDTPLLADILALLVLSFSQGQHGGLPIPLADIHKAVQMLPLVFPGPLASGGRPVVLSDEGTATCVGACQLLGSACSAMGRAKPGTQDVRSLQHNLIMAIQGCLQGLTSVAAPSLPAYMAAACKACQMLMAQVSCSQATFSTQHQLALIDATRSFLVPSLLRLFNENGDSNATAAGILALEAILRVSTLGAAPAEVQHAGLGLCAHLLSLKVISVCSDLLAVLPFDSTSVHHSVWSLLLLLQQADAAECPEPLQLQLSTQSFKAAVEKLCISRDLQSAIQAIAVHGSEAFSPCGNAPLAIVASALMHGDPVADPGWVMQAMLAVCGSCSPASCADDVTVLAAAIHLYIMAEGMQLALPHKSAAVPCLLASALEQYVQLHPECMELGSRLADWVLAHCHDLEGITAKALQQYLLDAAQVSHATRQHVLDHLSSMMAANSQMVAIVFGLLLHLEATGDNVSLYAILDLLLVWQLHGAPQASASLFDRGILQFCSRQLLQHRACTTPASTMYMTQLIRVLQQLVAWAGASFCETGANSHEDMGMAGEGIWDPKCTGVASALQDVMTAAMQLCPHMLDLKARRRHLQTTSGAAMLAAFLDLLSLSALYALADASGALHETVADLLGVVAAQGISQLVLDLLSYSNAHAGEGAMLQAGSQQQQHSLGITQAATEAAKNAALQLHALVCLVQAMYLLPGPQPSTDPLLQPACTTALLAATFMHAGPAKADLLCVLWAGGSALRQATQGPPGVLLMQLQNAAVDADHNLSSSGAMGLCSDLPDMEADLACSSWSEEVLAKALDRLCGLHASYKSTTRAMSSGYGDPCLAAAPVLVKMLPELLLVLRFTHLRREQCPSVSKEADQQQPGQNTGVALGPSSCGQVGTARAAMPQAEAQSELDNSGGAAAAAAAAAAGLPEAAAAQAASQAERAGVGAARAPGSDQSPGGAILEWVAAAAESAIKRTSNSLLPLLLEPPQALAHWVNALSAGLMRAGELQAYLPHMREACRAAAWQESMGQRQQGEASLPSGIFHETATSSCQLGLSTHPDLHLGTHHGMQQLDLDMPLDTHVDAQQLHQDTQQPSWSQDDPVTLPPSYTTTHDPSPQERGRADVAGPKPCLVHSLVCAALPFAVGFSDGHEGSPDLVPRVVISHMGPLVFLSAWTQGRRPFKVPEMGAQELMHTLQC